jgi:hypothetical protein
MTVVMISSNNTINVSTSVQSGCNIYGGYSLLSDAIRNVVPAGKFLSSTISIYGILLMLMRSVTFLVFWERICTLIQRMI